MKRASPIIFLIIVTVACFGQNPVTITSPDARIRYSFQLTKDKPLYSVSYRGKAIIRDSELGLTFLETGTFQSNLKLVRPVYKNGVERYQLVVGKKKLIRDSYNEVTIPLEETSTPFRKINVVVKAFNDGLAFRYEILPHKNRKSFTLTEENSTFHFVNNPKVLALFLPHFTTSHEGEYSSMRLTDVKEDTLMDMPALFELNESSYVAVTEAALLDYAGMYLIKSKGVLTSRLSPLPDQTSTGFVGAGKIKVKGTLPHKTPWRVLLISNRIGALIESTIITSLNEPNRLPDVTWIKPGKTTFPWWNGSIIPDTTFAPGNNFENNKYYIDFCARNGIEYHSVVESGGHEWYTNDGEGYQPGPNVDITKPVEGLNMKKICEYAKSKGVAIRVWTHWKALYPKLDTAFALFEEWGLSGLMVDFMDRDDQEMINIKEEILRKAAKHKLHIQFHGVEKPTGLSRTYPHELTREGTLNYEVNKWDKKVTPDHDLNIAFTRLLAGPTDYHLGGFRAVPDSLFKIQYDRPLMLGTRCHMLAMYVVLESYLGMVCDYPEAYENEPGFEFVQKVPTSWEDTKVLSAEIGKYLVIARKIKGDWFVGAINNHQPRKLVVDFNFLNEGVYLSEVYSDANNTPNDPNLLVKQTVNIKKSDSLTIQLAAGGGMAMHIRKQR